LVHACSAILYVIADRALGLNTRTWCYLVGVPLINIARFLPIHVAGIGLVEAGLWVLLSPWAGRTAEEVTAISVLVRMMGLLWLALSNSAMLCVQIAFRSGRISNNGEQAQKRVDDSALVSSFSK
jgi:hypothetical protein